MNTTRARVGRAPLRRMAVLALLVTILPACSALQLASTPPPDIEPTTEPTLSPTSADELDDIAAAVRAGEIDRAGDLRRALFADARMHERLAAEHLALLALDDTADPGDDRVLAQVQRALDANYASLAAHYNAMIWAERAGDTDMSGFHERVLAAMLADHADTGSGSRDAPYRVVNLDETELIQILLGLETLGSRMFMEGSALLLEVLARGRSERRHLLYFDFGPMLDGTTRAVAPRLRERQHEWNLRLRFELLRGMAEQGVRPAQVALADWAVTIAQDREQVQRAADLLERDHAAGNAIALAALARAQIYLAAYGPGDVALLRRENAIDLLIAAINAGYHDAIVDLTRVMATGWGRDLDATAVRDSLEACAAASVPRCLFGLAASHLWEPSGVVPQDEARGWSLMRAAAAAGYDRAIYGYALHVLASDDPDRATEKRHALNWLERAAERGSPWSSALLGRLHLQGDHVARDFARARRLWEHGLTYSLDADPRLINDVVWILSAAADEEVRDGALALRLMNALMSRLPPTRRPPAYLDTWAAAFAAVGNFERAIGMQREALRVAEAAGYGEETLQIFRDHLQAFERGEAVRELAW
jgi:TPR repeat protein